MMMMIFSCKNGIREASNKSVYLVAVRIPENKTTDAAPLLDIPAHVWIFGGCFAFLLS